MKKQELENNKDEKVLNQYEREGIVEQERALKYSRLVRDLLKSLPRMISDEVVVFEQYLGPLTDEEIGIVSSLLKSFEDTKRELTVFIEDSPVDSSQLARYVYNVALGKVAIGEEMDEENIIQPKGPIGVNLNDPYAVIMYVSNDEDMEALYGRRVRKSGLSPAGFYCDDIDPEFRSIKQMPFICVKTLITKYFRTNHSVLVHEKEHAISSRLNLADREAESIVILGRTRNYNFNQARFAGKKLTEKWAVDRSSTEQDIFQTEEWMQIKTYLLNETAEEVLAEYWGDPYKHFNNVRTLSSCYNFLDHCGIEDETLKEMLRKEYQEEINRQVRPAFDLIDFYKNDKVWKKRFEIFGYVLGKIPIESWSEYLYDSMFRGEMEEYKGMERDLEKIYMEEVEISEDDWDKFNAAHKNLMNQIQESSDTSQLENIFNFRVLFRRLTEGY